MLIAIQQDQVFVFDRFFPAVCHMCKTESRQLIS